MTSNQIDFLEAQESQRHNKAYEEETQRHNVAMESLSKEQNAINAEKVRNDRDYQNNSLQLQSQIAAKQLAWEQASGTEKLRLEGEKNSLQAQLNTITEAYNIRSNELRAQENDVKSRTQKETVRWNMFMQDIETNKLSQDYWYKSMALDYQNRALETSNELKRQELEDARAKVAADVAFNASRLEQLEWSVASDLAKSQADAAYTAEKQRWLPLDVFFGGLKSAASLFK